jgi:hypothetical protein
MGEKAMADMNKNLQYLTAIILSLGSLFAAVGFAWRYWAQFRKAVQPLWNRILKPFLKFVLTLATLVVPMGLIIGIIFYEIALFYWKKQSMDFIITNQTVFSELIILQTVFVSIYAFIWFTLILPRLRTWLRGQE